jgi:hypothetical protein
MPRDISESLSGAHHAQISALRSEAAELLQKLDESDLIEAAALMSSTIDAIDSSLRRLEGES